jgi:hypothetical protein
MRISLSPAAKLAIATARMVCDFDPGTWTSPFSAERRQMKLELMSGKSDPFAGRYPAFALPRH